VDADDDGVCDDCVIEEGTSQECGCNTGIAEGACDCDGNVLDECAVCGGNGVDADNDGVCDDVDDCVVQDGASQECGCNTGIAEGTCDCDGNTPTDLYGGDNYESIE
jgi:hypothetical protein